MKKSFIKGVFQDETGSPSSKRIIGFIASMILCGLLVYDCLDIRTSEPSQTLVDSVQWIALGALGFSSIDKFSLKKKTDEAPKIEEPVKEVLEG